MCVCVHMWDPLDMIFSGWYSAVQQEFLCKTAQMFGCCSECGETLALMRRQLLHYPIQSHYLVHNNIFTIIIFVLFSYIVFFTPSLLPLVLSSFSCTWKLILAFHNFWLRNVHFWQQGQQAVHPLIISVQSLFQTFSFTCTCSFSHLVLVYLVPLLNVLQCFLNFSVPVGIWVDFPSVANAPSCHAFKRWLRNVRFDSKAKQAVHPLLHHNALELLLNILQGSKTTSGQWESTRRKDRAREWERKRERAIKKNERRRKRERKCER